MRDDLALATAEREAAASARGEKDLPVLACLALLCGALTGLLATAFRLCLHYAEGLRDRLITAAHGHAVAGFAAVVAATAVLALLAAFLVRRVAPHATGSGIPHVEAVLHGKIDPAPYGLVPVKFLGGIMAIGGGLMLGREGPSVQMGAGLSLGIGRIFRQNWAVCRELFAAGAGAGLATAFNAPIAGAVFVLEELVQRFEHRIAVAALGAAAGAITVSRLLVPDVPDFSVPAIATPEPSLWPLFVLLGCIAGFAGVAYNRAILGALAAADATKAVRVEVRAALIGALIGAIAWSAPDLVGGGDDITQGVLAGNALLTVMPAIFIVRFVLGAVCYAAGTPGGLFAPLLVLGSQIGFLFGAACAFLLHVSLPPEAFAVIGMAAFFAGVVRAPLTGIVLVGEMTANTSLLLASVFASFAAMTAASLTGDRPIYDALRDRTILLETRLRSAKKTR